VTADRVVAWAPGRVNLIGEHTDYNQGLCLPFAIERGITVTATRRAHDIEAHARDLRQSDAFPVGSIEPAGGWRSFVRGVVAELRADGFPVVPASLEIAGDVPAGAGLGSSAALEVALCLALLELAGVRDPDRIRLAKLCSRVENEWVGAQTGLLDQLAVLFGRERHALRLDMATLHVEPVPLALGGWSLVTADSGTRHAHAASGYNERRAECQAACEALGLSSLRDATWSDVDRLPAPLDRRVRHVVSENERVVEMVDALRASDAEAVGRLLDESHASLRDDYEVSVSAVENLIADVKESGARGARIVGGGFGGNVLALFPPDVEPPETTTSVSAGPAAGVLEPLATD
jgi:galactokinase